MTFGRKDSTAGTPAQPRPEAPRAPGFDPANPAYREKSMAVFDRLISTVDAGALLNLPVTEGRQFIQAEIRKILRQDRIVLSAAAEAFMLDEICDEMLGYGPLERLLARDDIADIMVNGPDNVFIETGGRIEKTDIRFRDERHLMNVCQRIVSRVGRRIDESSPICDARLADGSRVNVIAPPLSLRGVTLTIRRFRRDKVTLDDLVRWESLPAPAATVLSSLARAGCNILISGGTGSGKTTLLNALTAFIDVGERIITCEDTAELQLQQPHVISLETRPPNLEGEGTVSMRDLVKNCLRMRPDRIIVGEVRGPEAFDLLQAMNTGHDGSMGMLHANSPREALSRLESMVTMGYPSLKTATIREMISSAVDVIVQASRMRDGSRKIVDVALVVGMEDGRVTLQRLFRFDVDNRGDPDARVRGQYIRVNGLTGVARQKAAYFGLEARIDAALDQL
ncbi:CpaF family protein [Meridianimarinicoccus sp. RP-17]